MAFGDRSTASSKKPSKPKSSTPPYKPPTAAGKDVKSDADRGRAETYKKTGSYRQAIRDAYSGNRVQHRKSTYALPRFDTPTRRGGMGASRNLGGAPIVLGIRSHNSAAEKRALLNAAARQTHAGFVTPELTTILKLHQDRKERAAEVQTAAAGKDIKSNAEFFPSAFNAPYSPLKLITKRPKGKGFIKANEAFASAGQFDPGALLTDVGTAFYQHPGKTTGATLKAIPGAAAGIVALPVRTGVETVSGALHGHPEKGVVDAANTIAQDYKARYAPYFGSGTALKIKAQRAANRKRLTQQGALGEILDLATVTGAGAAVTGRTTAALVRRSTAARRAYQAQRTEYTHTVSALQDLHDYIQRVEGAPDSLDKAEIRRRLANGEYTQHVDPDTGETFGGPLHEQDVKRAIRALDGKPPSKGGRSFQKRTKEDVLARLYRQAAPQRPRLAVGPNMHLDQEQHANFFRNRRGAKRDVRRERVRVSNLVDLLTEEGTQIGAGARFARAHHVVPRDRFSATPGLRYFTTTARLSRKDVSALSSRAHIRRGRLMAEFNKGVDRELGHMDDVQRAATVYGMEGLIHPSDPAASLKFIDARIEHLVRRRGGMPAVDQMEADLAGLRDRQAKLEKQRIDLHNPESGHRDYEAIKANTQQRIELTKAIRELDNTISEEKARPGYLRNPVPRILRSGSDELRVLRQLREQLVSHPESFNKSFEEGLGRIKRAQEKVEMYDPTLAPAQRAVRRYLPQERMLQQAGLIPERPEAGRLASPTVREMLDNLHVSFPGITEEMQRSIARRFSGTSSLSAPVVKSIERHLRKRHEHLNGVGEEAKAARKAADALGVVRKLGRGMPVQAMTAAERRTVEAIIGPGRVAAIEAAERQVAAIHHDQPVTLQMQAARDQQAAAADAIAAAEQALERHTRDVTHGMRKLGRAEGRASEAVRTDRARRAGQRKRRAAHTSERIARAEGERDALLDKARAQRARAHANRTKIDGARSEERKQELRDRAERQDALAAQLDEEALAVEDTIKELRDTVQVEQQAIETPTQPANEAFRLSLVDPKLQGEIEKDLFTNGGWAKLSEEQRNDAANAMWDRVLAGGEAPYLQRALADAPGSAAAAAEKVHPLAEAHRLAAEKVQTLEDAVAETQAAAESVSRETPRNPYKDISTQYRKALDYYEYEAWHRKDGDPLKQAQARRALKAVKDVYDFHQPEAEATRQQQIGAMRRAVNAGVPEDAVRDIRDESLNYAADRAAFAQQKASAEASKEALAGVKKQLATARGQLTKASKAMDAAIALASRRHREQEPKPATRDVFRPKNVPQHEEAILDALRVHELRNVLSENAAMAVGSRGVGESRVALRDARDAARAADRSWKTAKKQSERDSLAALGEVRQMAVGHLDEVGPQLRGEVAALDKQLRDENVDVLRKRLIDQVQQGSSYVSARNAEGEAIERRPLVGQKEGLTLGPGSRAAQILHAQHVAREEGLPSVISENDAELTRAAAKHRRALARADRTVPLVQPDLSLSDAEISPPRRAREAMGPDFNASYEQVSGTADAMQFLAGHGADSATGRMIARIAQEKPDSFNVPVVKERLRDELGVAAQRPAYLPHERYFGDEFGSYTVKGIRAAAKRKHWGGVLQDIGYRTTDPRLVERAAARNIRNRLVTEWVVQAMENHSIEVPEWFLARFPDKKQADLHVAEEYARHLGLGEKSRRGRSGYVLVNPGKATTDLVRNLHEHELDPNGAHPNMSEAMRAVVHDPYKHTETPVYQSVGDWRIMTREAADEMLRLSEASHFLLRGWDIHKGTLSRALLTMGNVPWLISQVLSNAMLMGVAGAGPLSAIRAARWYHSLDSETRSSVDAMLGVEELHYDLHKPRLASSVNNGFYTSWRAFRDAPWFPTGRGGHVRFRPIAAANDLMLKADRITSNAMRRGVFYKGMRKETVRRLDREVAGMAREQEKIVRGMRGTPEQQMRNLLANRPAIERHAQHVIRFMGDYNRMTAMERHTIGRVFMFYGWLRFSLHFAFWTLPMRHPLAYALAFRMGEAERTDIQRLLGTQNELPFQLGYLYYKGDHGDVRQVKLAQLNPLLNQAVTFFNEGADPRQLIGMTSPAVALLFDDLYLKSSFTGRAWRLNSETGDAAHANALDRAQVAASDLLSLSSAYRTASKVLTQGRPQSTDSLPVTGRVPLLKALGGEENPAYKRKDLIAAVQANEDKYNRRGPFKTALGLTLAPIVPQSSDIEERLARQEKLKRKKAKKALTVNQIINRTTGSVDVNDFLPKIP